MGCFDLGTITRSSSYRLLDRYRWLEPRHQVNIQGRWVRDKTDDLQFAFFNGEGWESWENVWGIWNGGEPRETSEATRRIATIERDCCAVPREPELGTIFSDAAAMGCMRAGGRLG